MPHKKQKAEKHKKATIIIPMSSTPLKALIYTHIITERRRFLWLLEKYLRYLLP